MINYKQDENENFLEYFKRMVRYKIDKVFDGTYSEWIYYVFGKEHSEDVARREYYGCKMFVEQLENESIELEDKDATDEMLKRKIALDVKRMQISDELTYLNRIKRENARYESFLHFAREYANDENRKRPFIQKEIKKNGKHKAILTISDWHYGIEIDNFINTFNPSIAKERINTLFNEVANSIETFDIDEVVVANLNDLCSGYIHTGIRIENRIDVAKQVVEVADLIFELLKNISNCGVKVRYYSTLDNHSRMIPNKKESMDNENFTVIIDEFLRVRFESSDDVEICSNLLDENITTFNIYNFKCCGVHGHMDNPSSIINNLSMMTKEFYDLFIMGHRHSPSLREEHGTRVLENGTLSGTDTYAKNIRKSSKPSQNLLICDEENLFKYLRIINL